MGSLSMAKCPCGFSQTVKVGGTMRDFLKYSTFPFYCSSCGVVDVNVATEGVHECPKCQSQDIIQYGDDRVSIPTQFNQSLQWGNYNCGQKDHLCPSCKQQTLSFNLYMMID